MDFDRTERRMRTKAPQLDLIRPKRTKSTVFAAGAAFTKSFAVCNRRVPGRHHRNDFLPHYRWVLDEPFQPGVGTFLYVWGLAIALVTQVLYKYKDRSAFWLFGMGTCWAVLTSICAAYLPKSCSVRYSGITVPCRLTWAAYQSAVLLFLGLAAVAWFKVLFPPLDRLIESLPAAAVPF